MKNFVCTACGSRVYFENGTCLSCGHSLGFDAGTLTLVAVEPVAPDGGLYRKIKANPGIKDAVSDVRFCENEMCIRDSL